MTETRRAPAWRCAAAAAFLVAYASAVVAQGTPKEVVDVMSSRVLEVLRDKSLSTEAKRTQVEEVIYQHVDFETLSRLVMGRNWRKLSDAEKKEFMAEFRQHLSDTYGENIDNYRNEKVKILSAREEKRGDVTVKSKILRGGSEDVVVDYCLRKTSDQWRIIDVVIEGVSLVANFRSQFQEIMTNGGPQRLLKLLREKNVGPPPGA